MIHATGPAIGKRTISADAPARAGRLGGIGLDAVDQRVDGEDDGHHDGQGSGHGAGPEMVRANIGQA